MDISGKTVVITGGSCGLGRAAAVALARAGARQVALIARNEARLRTVAEEVTNEGAACIWIQADVRVDAEVARAFETIADRFGSIDIVVSNAGVGAHKGFDELTAEEADFVIDVNVCGVMNVMRAAVAKMRGRGGLVVNVASALGKIPLFGHAVYTASKAAVVALSRAGRKELKQTGVKIICFCPGVIDTPFQDDRREELERMPRFVVQTPQKVAGDLVRMIRREPKEYFGQFYLRVVHFFYRLLAG